MNKMDLILAELQGVNKRLDKVEKNQLRHEEMISQLMQIVGATNGKVLELQKDVAVLKEDVTVLKEDVAILNEDDADLKITAKLLTEGQKRQDRILEALSVRSLEQETEIKELRRAV